MFSFWQEQFDRFLPHIHCLDNDNFIISNTIMNDGFTVIQYSVIALILFIASKWGSKKGDWSKLCVAGAFVFIFCSINYLMNIVIIYQPLYYLQLLFKFIGNLFFLKAVYHLITLDKTALSLLFKAMKKTIKDGKF